MRTDLLAQPTDAQALADATIAAGYAPSIHNTQPWRWRTTGNTLDLHTEPSRVLAVTDPDRWLAVLSCGAALHHARIALAARGWRATVVRLPSPTDHPDHLAHLSLGQQAPIDEQAARLLPTIRLRHTDRRPVPDLPVEPDALRAITSAVAAEGARLHILRRDQVLELATATDRAQRVEAADPAWQTEVAQWSGGARPTGTGVPDAAIPHDPPRTTVPGRDFGHPGDQSISTTPDHAAVFAILYGDGDEPMDWLRAGEALSAAWLTATDLGVSVQPYSAPIEVVAARESLRAVLAGIGRPHLVLRFGTTDPDEPAPAHAPRLRTEETIEPVTP